MNDLARHAGTHERAWPALLSVPWGPWLVLAVSFCLTYVLWQNELKNAHQYLQAEFDTRVQDVAERVEDRMQTYAQVLRGVRGLFAASVSVERHEFHDFIQILQVQQHYPGIQGIAFVQLVAPLDLELHIATMRHEGFPDYVVFPEGRREIYSAIVFIEPFSGVNLRAFGYDMLTNPQRRLAMEQARDTGNAVITEKVTLIQDAGQRAQAGVVMYLPVYRNGSRTGDAGQRRAALAGWIGAPFGMDDLMEGILGKSNTDIDLHLYDGVAGEPARLLHDANPAYEFGGDPSAQFQVVRQLNILDRKWTMAVRSLPAFEDRIDRKKAQLILAGGTFASALLAQLAWLLLHGRKRALHAAQDMQQINRRLQDAEERWRFALEGAGDGVWDCDFATDRVFLSERCRQMLGFAQENINLAMEEWGSRIHPEDASHFRQLWQEAMVGAIPAFELEQRLRSSKGGWKWVQVRGMVVSRATQGRPLRMIGTLSDISARKHAEQVLRESEARFRMLWETTSDVVLIIDESGRIEYANPALQTVFGYAPSAMMGEDIGRLQPPELRQAHKEAMARYIRTGEKKLDWRGISTYGLHRDGHRFPVEVSFSHIETGGRHIFAGFMRDITTRKQAEEKILELNQSLEQRVLERTAQLDLSNRELQAFSYSVSHDLRAPLRGINGWSQALEEEYASRLDEQGRSYLQRVRLETERMGHLIDDLLHLSRVTQSDMRSTVVDLSSLAVGALERLRAASPGRQVDVRIEGGLQAQGDPGLLQIALENLLDNAWKFTAGTSQARIEFFRISEHGQDVFAVCDNGAGFDMKKAQKLYSPFQRMHRQTEFPGTGIGLATVQRIIARHGGKIRAESQPGRGACFYFTLKDTA